MSKFKAHTYRLGDSNRPVVSVDSKSNELAPYKHAYTSGQQPLPNPNLDQLSKLALFGAGVGAFAYVGHMRFGKKRGFDYYHQAARAIEEGSPGRIFRTFQVSQALSPFTTQAQQYRFISGDTLRAMNKTAEGWMWTEQLKKVVGQDLGALGVYEQGLTFREGKLFLGRTNQVVLQRAFIIESGIDVFGTLQKGYIRSLFGKEWEATDEGLKAAFTKSFKWEAQNLSGVAREVESAFWIAGGTTGGRAASRFLTGYGTALIERMNRLAMEPAEMQPMRWLFEQAPIKWAAEHLPVKSSSGFRTLGRMTAKLGIVAGLGYLAYSQVDYWTRKSKMLDKTGLAEGVTPAIAHAGITANLKISRMADRLGLHSYRERQEKIAPGSTNLKTLAAFPIVGLLGASITDYAQRLRQEAGLRRQGWSRDSAATITRRTDEVFQDLIAARVPPKDMVAREELFGRLEKLAAHKTAKFPTQYSLMEAEALGRAEKLAGGAWGKIARFVAETGAKETPVISRLARKLGYMTPSKTKAIFGLVAGLGLIAPFIPGALIPSQRPEELEATYSGRKRVPVRKGRWWEFGRSPYEGENIMYYRPHWYPRLLARGHEKGIYDEDMSPAQRWFKENFTYEMEEKHYYDRPYPITGAAFEDIPLIGPVLAATIGRFVKPPKLMHKDEWMRARQQAQGASDESVVEYAAMPKRFGQVKVAPEAGGELEQGAPITPYGAKGVIGEQAWRFQEMVGLPGFSMFALKENITGEETLFSQEERLESARRMYGAERTYWDAEVGGGLGTTELFRRLYPHRRRSIPLYNPIRNLMPEWLPGPGERSPDFLHGDPYTKVQEGEIRLPGPGYAALYPELEGVEPADYPMIHKYKILADVAPFTEKFDQIAIQARSAAKRGELSEQEIAIIEQTKAELKARREKKIFYPYKYRERAYTTVAEQLLTEANEKAKHQGDASAMERALGSYWETLTHNVETPLEFLTPMSPGAKLVHQRTALEDYEREQIYGTKAAFWGHPLRDFMYPTGRALKHSLGSDEVPEVVQEKRQLEDYFDILKYTKFTALKQQAAQDQDVGLEAEYEQKRRETLFGVNPYTYQYSSIFRALPRRERDYFNAFVEADMNERARLLEVLPDNEKQLYTARWQLKDAADTQKAIKQGLLTQKEVDDAQGMFEELYQQRQTEGMPTSKELWTEYLATRYPGESYPDWYRRTYLMAQKLEGKPMPGPDWVGFHPTVDLDDVKLKVVKDLGLTPTDYDLWPEQERNLARRPGVAEGAQALQGNMSESEIQDRVRQVLNAHGLGTASVTIMSSPGPTSVDIDINEDRSGEIASIAKRANLG